MARKLFVQTVDLGALGSFSEFCQDTLPQGGQLGNVIEGPDGKFWRLVKIDEADAVDYIDGGVAYWKDKANFQVTADASDAEGLANGVAGGVHVAIDVSTLTATKYIFVQCGGDQAAVVVAASTVNGDHMTGHASTDNVLTRTAAGTAPVDKLVATALSTRGTTTTDNGASLANSSKVRWVLGNLL